MIEINEDTEEFWFQFGIDPEHLKIMLDEPEKREFEIDEYTTITYEEFSEDELKMLKALMTIYDRKLREIEHESQSDNNS